VNDTAATLVAASPAAPLDEATLEQLQRLWDRPRGIYGWLATVNHKDIAMRYIVTAFVFFVLAGILALLMRTRSDSSLPWAADTSIAGRPCLRLVAITASSTGSASKREETM